jgi:hypothetical protein
MRLLLLCTLLPISLLAGPSEADLQARLEALRERKVAADEAAAEHHYRLRQIVLASRQAADELQARITAGIPHQREQRLGAVAAAQAALNSEETTRQAAGIRLLLQVFYDELRLLNTVQVSHAMAPVGDSREKHATFIRLGLAASYFLTEDGSAAGIAAKDWRIADSATAEQIAAMLAILSKQQPPAILPVPVP